MASEEQNSSSRRLLSITDSFNAVWFCYSPVYQLQQYYRHGRLDNCAGKWSALMDSFLLKTKKASEVQETIDAREKARPHIWRFRSREQASAFWKTMYGHLNDME